MEKPFRLHGLPLAALAAACFLLPALFACQKSEDTTSPPKETTPSGTVAAKDTAPPRILSADPADGDTSVAAGGQFRLTVLLEDRDGIDRAAVTRFAIGGRALAGSTNSAGCPKGETVCRIVFTPEQPLPPDSTVDWEVEAADKPGNVSRETLSFRTASASGPQTPYQASVGDAADTDGDGIPDAVESNILRTNPRMKTLFIRPLKTDDTYWLEFKNLLEYRRPGSSNRTVREIFRAKGIEIVIVGDPQNPYDKMRSVNYDPAADPNHPPCDMVTVTADKYCAPCNDVNHRGHIYFDASQKIWVWSTKGMTRSDDNGYGYHNLSLFLDSLTYYFREGAYETLEVLPSSSAGLFSRDRNPLTLDCNAQNSGCADSPKSLLNEARQIPGRLLGSYECDGSGFVTTGYAGGRTYDLNEVLARTLAHELGHALLNGYGCAFSSAEQCADPSRDDHCCNPECIMSRYVTTRSGWDIKDFGEGSGCTHGAGGAKDIGAQGIVHNRIRNIQAQAH